MLSYEQFDKKRIVENVFGEEFAIQVYKNLEKKIINREEEMCSHSL